MHFERAIICANYLYLILLLLLCWTVVVIFETKVTQQTITQALHYVLKSSPDGHLLSWMLMSLIQRHEHSRSPLLPLVTAGRAHCCPIGSGIITENESGRSAARCQRLKFKQRKS